MFRDRFEEATILGTGPDGLTRVITRKSWAERESVLVEAGRPSRPCSGNGSSSTKRRARVHALVGFV
jgi:hypothetical protein